MGMKFKDVCYKEYIDKLSLDLNSNQVISIISSDELKVNDFFDLIYGFVLPEEGEIILNRKVIDRNVKEKKIIQVRKDIAYCSANCNDMLFNVNILEDIKYGLKKFNDKKLYELLELFNLNEKILKKNYIEISDSEKKKVCLISALLKDSKIILLSNLTACLDTKSKQNLVKYIRKEKRNNKIFIISSQDSDFLLQVSDKLLIINDNEITVQDDKYDIFGNKEFMNNMQMNIPWVIKFKNRVLEMKNIKLNHRDNINDLLKDIYRNATKVNK